MQKLIALALIVCWAPATFGAELRIGCQNPQRPYLVVYDSTARTLIIDPDTEQVAYKVTRALLAAAEGEVGYNSGLTFRADFGLYPRIEFYSGGKLVQTDKCDRGVLDLMGN